MINFFKQVGMPFVLALTLGLAPFFPEPHIVGKIRWMLGGAVGMQLMDWFDVLLHGAPWLWLFYSISLYFGKAKSDKG